MTVSYTHKPPTPKIVNYAKQRYKALETQIELALEEQRLWKNILKRLPRCRNCEGYGEVSYQPPNSGGTTKHKKCLRCNGTGEPH